MGFEFQVNGRCLKLFGTLATVSADNLGSLALGGFKESCSATKMCRHCMATKEESQTKVSYVPTCKIYHFLLSFLSRNFNYEKRHLTKFNVKKWKRTKPGRNPRNME